MFCVALQTPPLAQKVMQKAHKHSNTQDIFEENRAHVVVFCKVRGLFWKICYVGKVLITKIYFGNLLAFCIVVTSKCTINSKKKGHLSECPFVLAFPSGLEPKSVEEEDISDPNVEFAKYLKCIFYTIFAVYLPYFA